MLKQWLMIPSLAASQLPAVPKLFSEILLLRHRALLEGKHHQGVLLDKGLETSNTCNTTPLVFFNLTFGKRSTFD
jgi:hypothetical protein